MNRSLSFAASFIERAAARASWPALRTLIVAATLVTASLPADRADAAPSTTTAPAPTQPAAPAPATAPTTTPAPAGASSAAPPAASETPAPAPAADAAIPVSEIAPRADAAIGVLRTTEEELRSQSTLARAQVEIGTLATDIQKLSERTEALLRRSPTLDALREADTNWADIERRGSAVTRELTRRLVTLDRTAQELEQTARQWNNTQGAAKASDAPSEVLERIERTIATIAETRNRVQQARSDLLALQTRAADLSSVAGEFRGRIAKAQGTALNRLFTLDRQPLWKTPADFWSGGALLQSSGESLSARFDELKTYLYERRGLLAVLLLAFPLLTFLLLRVRRALQAQQQDDPQLTGAVMAFQQPAAIAGLLTVLSAIWLFRAPPGLFPVVTGIIGAIPVAIIGRTMLGSFRPVVHALIGLFVVDQVRMLTESLPAQAAIGFILECLLVMAVGAWLIRRSARPMPLVSAPDLLTARRYVGILARLGAWVGAISLWLYVSGLTALADLTLRGFLVTSYAAVVLYSLSRIGEGLLAAVLRSWPFTWFAVVRNHRPVLAARGNRLLAWGLLVAWILIALEALSLRRPAWHWLLDILRAEAGHGAYKISLGGALAFVLTVGAAWLLSRTIKLLLQEEVYPRVELPRGVPYAVSSIVHYLLMFIGTLMAVSALGIDLTGFTVLSGAFGVGLGLGLQSVVNNFVSGLILLFERPVKLGDMVQLDDLNGRIDRIGIRATVLRLGNGAEVIVPNGKLLSDRLTNWTFSSRLRRIDVDFTTELGADPDTVREMMLEQAAKTDGLVARPAPQALLTRLGPDTLGFNLQVWTEEALRWPRIQSELLLGLNRRLREMGVRAK